jgi:putative membrane protein
MTIIRHAGVIAWLLGIAIVIGLVIWSGIGPIAHAIASVGWGILLVLAVRIGTVSLAGVGWQLLFPAKNHPGLGTCVLVRFIREAANALLPLMQVGGDLIGARLIMFRVAGPLAAASIIVDILIQAGTQFLFACLGVAALVALGASDGLARTIASALAVAAILLAGFYLAQRRAGQRILQWIMNALTGDRQWRVLGTIDAVYEQLATIYASRRRLFLSSFVHMIGWLVGVAEVLIVFAWMGHPIGLGEAIVIESLLHAVRGAAFAIPGALGAQEGGLVLLCSLFGIPPEQAIALSLVKRVPDVVLGVPSLLAWQLMEWQRLQASRSSAEGPSQEASDRRSRDP